MRQTTRVRLTFACAALFLSAAAFAADDWDAFWKSVKVSPAPPRDFIEGRSLARVQNLTVGRISDETARTDARQRNRSDHRAGSRLGSWRSDVGFAASL